jgi:hypothetical protein
MRRRHFLALGVLVSLALSGCGDSPLAPPPDSSESLLGILDGNQTAEVVHRTTPLAQDEVVSKLVGPLGGQIVLPKSGLTITVPVGAVSSPVDITVTAPAGDLVGYHFAPHGLVFNKKLIATQKITGTEIGLLNAVLNPPFAGYFEGQLVPTIDLLEILRLNLLGLLGVVQWEIPHFSGYVIATDRTSHDDEDE